MKNIFSVIFMNFWGYDLIIFLAAAFTGFVFYSTKKSADRLHKKMNLTLYAPDSNAWREAEEEITGLRESDVIAMRNHTSKLYSLFVNLTGIFPLLGLVSDMQDVTGNFYGALTSTFWGLVFAIVFKFLDGVICPEIEDNEKSVQLFLERGRSAERITL